MTYPSKHISVSIELTPQEVYAYTSQPTNLPHWAAGLSQSKISKTKDGWLADSPMGQVLIEFAPANDFGVMDHAVTLPSGEINQNPFRVVGNGKKGSEVIFTLYRLPKMSEEEFEKDAQMILADLRKLKLLLESKI